MLTDKTKEAFEKWLLNKFKLDSALYGHYEYLHFSKLPFSMQYGVIVDFFDENEIYTIVQPYFELGAFLGYDWSVNPDGMLYEGFEETLPEARKNAILKANNLLNETN